MKELGELRELGEREESTEEWLLNFIEKAEDHLSPEDQLSSIRGMLYRRLGRGTSGVLYLRTVLAVGQTLS